MILLIVSLLSIKVQPIKTSTMKNLTMLLLFVFVFSLFGYSQKSPAGLVVVGSHCASGDYDYYFFSDKQVIAVWALGEEASLLTGRSQRHLEYQ